MAKARIVLALILSYMLFAMLLNSVGTVILQSIETFYISKSHASILEAFKDLTIAGVSFLVASFLPRLGFRRAIMLGLGLVALACVAMPLAPASGRPRPCSQRSGRRSPWSRSRCIPVLAC
ncbi:hypothetical protein [Hankyongella ginsenosidimutans]|uniref:hypothetical protein n=1 Tax=Hankyongella ginsenosidimutans TaxID=1763828 RepID=UPI001FE34412|nr:hypothetical protein [Hankyongella ginsenosidimutans]